MILRYINFRYLSIYLSDAQPWVSECPDVKNYKRRSGTG